MFRFILNFIIFGILFYAIYVLFPDAFRTLVSWADGAYEVIREFVAWLIEKVNDWREEHMNAALPSSKAFLKLFTANYFQSL